MALKSKRRFNLYRSLNSRLGHTTTSPTEQLHNAPSCIYIYIYAYMYTRVNTYAQRTQTLQCMARKGIEILHATNSTCFHLSFLPLLLVPLRLLCSCDFCPHWFLHLSRINAHTVLIHLKVAIPISERFTESNVTSIVVEIKLTEFAMKILWRLILVFNSIEGACD